MSNILDTIHTEAEGLGTVRIMEVCGTHAETIHRYGIPQLLPDNVSLISGPGCPVCVTPRGYIDAAISLADRGIKTATFGDMMRVPGTEANLEEARASGADIRVVYSPRDALHIAEQAETVFLAVGFETTAAPVAATVIEARERSIQNFKILSTHKLIPPALEALFCSQATSEQTVRGLICPGHVSVIIGARAYRRLSRQARLPCVIAGFEPEDVLLAVLIILRQIREDAPVVEVEYDRWVSDSGNKAALKLIETVFIPTTAEWRGLGLVPQSGLRLRDRFEAHDAELCYKLSVQSVPDPPGCRCAEVIRGELEPPDCALFARSCKPESPVGACMVSSEGSCAIRYKYRPARQ